MGFWGTLGKIGMIAGPIAAAPFTGGSSLLTTLGLGAKAAQGIGAGLGAAGRIAGGISSGRAKGRADEATLESLLASRNNQTQLERSRLALGAQGQRQGQLVGADLLGSMHAPTDPRAMKFASGSSVSPETIAGIRSRATNALNTGSDVPQLQTPQVPQAGKADSFLNALSYGGTALGALGQLKPPPQTPMPPQMTDMPALTIEDLLKQQGGYA